jgi:hypothetical protein
MPDRPVIQARVTPELYAKIQAAIRNLGYDNASKLTIDAVESCVDFGCEDPMFWAEVDVHARRLGISRGKLLAKFIPRMRIFLDDLR